VDHAGSSCYAKISAIVSQTFCTESPCKNIGSLGSVCAHPTCSKGIETRDLIHNGVTYRRARTDNGVWYWKAIVEAAHQESEPGEPG